MTNERVGMNVDLELKVTRKIKPCPFCGVSGTDMTGIVGMTNMEAGDYPVACTNEACGHCLPMAASDWNAKRYYE